jgi:hypothetical protein
MDRTGWIAIAVGLGMLACDQSGTAPSGPGVSGKPAVEATQATGTGATAGAADTSTPTATDAAPDAEATGDEEAAGHGDFAEPGGHFTVAFPSPPTVEERTTTTAVGTVRLKTFTAADGDARLVVSMGAMAPGNRKHLDVGGLAAAIRDENLAPFVIARKEEHGFETDGLPGLNVSYLGASGTIEVRGVLRVFIRRAPLTFYVVHAMAPPATDEVSLRLFVESFAPAATVSAMDEVLARAAQESAEAQARTRAARPEARRSGPPSGTAIYRWSSVRTTGPGACVFFAGPVPRSTRRSYGRGSGTWTFSGRRARFELGGVVDFSGTVRNGRVSVRSVERASLDGHPYTFTETITGKMDAAGRFRGTYRYSDCRTDGTERCPGPCTIRATLTGSP